MAKVAREAWMRLTLSIGGNGRPEHPSKRRQIPSIKMAMRDPNNKNGDTAVQASISDSCKAPGLYCRTAIKFMREL